MLRVALIGAGRMGQAICHAIAANNDFQLACLCVRHGGESTARDALAASGVGTAVRIVSNPTEIVDTFDVAIDFSLPTAVPDVLTAVVSAGKPLVCGVTGLNANALSAIRSAASRIPLLYDRNMSIGIAVMEKLARQAGAGFGVEFVASVSETHHVHKVDAPSGTALKLAEALATSRGQDFQSVYRFDPDGFLREQPEGSVVVSAFRRGENPGEHTVRFTGPNESLELIHKVSDRAVFADGALRAARWLVKQPAGLYSVSDLLV